MLNPHVTEVHVPAHVYGILGLVVLLAFPSWQGVLAFLTFNLWFSAFGMSIGFHRYFTHRSFKTSTFWRRFMFIGGTLAGQGSVIFWTALHRQHHPASDTELDIHTPRKGLWHAYMGWIFTLDPEQVSMARASDLIRDPWCRWTHRNYSHIMWGWWMTLTLAACVPVLRPWACGAMVAGMWSIHQEALINSVCHDSRFGSRPHATSDDSRDVHWLRYLTWGQSLHNTHHRYPADASFGEHDTGYSIIRLIRTKHEVSV